MKITNVEAYPVAEGRHGGLFVVVDTDEGIYGVGESGLRGRAQAVIGAIIGIGLRRRLRLLRGKAGAPFFRLISAFCIFACLLSAF